MKLPNWMNTTSKWLVYVGAITWGTVQWFQFNLIELVGGMGPTWAMPTAYTLVGLAGILVLAKDMKWVS